MSGHYIHLVVIHRNPPNLNTNRPNTKCGYPGNKGNNELNNFERTSNCSNLPVPLTTSSAVLTRVEAPQPTALAADNKPSVQRLCLL